MYVQAQLYAHEIIIYYILYYIIYYTLCYIIYYFVKVSCFDHTQRGGVSKSIASLSNCKQNSGESKKKIYLPLQNLMNLSKVKDATIYEKCLSIMNKDFKPKTSKVARCYKFYNAAKTSTKAIYLKFEANSEIQLL